MDKQLLKENGISSKAILDYYKKFNSIGGENHGLIIAVNGKRVYEEYCYPYTAETPQNMFSVTKALVSIALGFAIDEGLVGLDDKILPYFPEYSYKPDKKWDKVTIRALLTMNSNKKFSFLQDITDDHTKLFMKAPFRKKEGFLYSNNDSHVIAALVEKVTGKHLDDYLDERLFSKIGIKKPFWEKNDKGVCVGGSGLFMTCSELATIGQCVANGGKWMGEQIIPENYLKEATRKQTIPSKTFHATGFGYYFWQDGETYRLEGLFGQFSVIIPDKNTVVSITSMHPSDYLIAKTIQEVLIANLFNEDRADDELEKYLAERDKILLPIAKERRSDIEATTQGKTYKRVGIITDVTHGMTQFQNNLIPNAIHSSYPSRPKKSFNEFSFNFNEDHLVINWKDDTVDVSFSSGTDGNARITDINYLQWTNRIWSYSYWEKGKLHVMTRVLNTISCKEFIFKFKKNGMKLWTVCKPDFSIFCGYNSVASGVFPTMPVVTPFLVGFLKAILYTTKMPVRFKVKK